MKHPRKAGNGRQLYTTKNWEKTIHAQHKIKSSCQKKFHVKQSKRKAVKKPGKDTMNLEYIKIHTIRLIQHSNQHACDVNIHSQW